MASTPRWKGDHARNFIRFSGINPDQSGTRPASPRERLSQASLRPTAGAASASPRLTYGSRIGGRDREQRIDIPAQEVDCQIEVEARHATAAGGWADDKLALLNDAPGRLDLGFSDPSQPIAQADDVRLSFVHTVP